MKKRNKYTSPKIKTKTINLGDNYNIMKENICKVLMKIIVHYIKEEVKE